MDLQTIQQAIKQIAAEKGLAEEAIAETINSALAAAYRKDFGDKNQNIILEFEPKDGKMKVYDKKAVVDFPQEIIDEIDENGRDKKFVKEIESQEEPLKFNPKTDILLEDAKKIKKNIKVGDELVVPLEVPEDFGRMAAQTAKQVIVQKIREAERETLFNEYKDKEGQLVIGVIQRRDPRGFLVDLGKAAALLPFEEQIKHERYNPGDRMKFYLVSVEQTIKGPEIIVSRASAGMIRKLFETEIPEIASGAIDIMGLAREAGSRSKIAVKSNQENIDPIGSCVGQRGARIQTIINELGGEKIDIIEYNEEPAKFITNSLSPANVAAIEINEEDKTAIVTVNEDQLSLAIGKEGQNVRLAAKLTGWKINILKETASGEKEKVEMGEAKPEDLEEKSESKEAEPAQTEEEPKTTSKKQAKTESAKKETKKKTKKTEKKSAKKEAKEKNQPKAEKVTKKAKSAKKTDKSDKKTKK
ncbi:MAG: transcription termination/antitermination protein NusA [Candidatus Buchananbacteria bacterium]|nr:transcription termination/antitermination protein NusA [Candidatus Buchananbacteria bacterium]